MGSKHCSEKCFLSVIVLFLKDFEFCFLLEKFSFIFDRSSVMFQMKQNQETDVVKIKEIHAMSNFLSFLENVHNETSFHQFDQNALQHAISLLGATLIIVRCTLK